MSNDNKKITIAILLITILGLVLYSYLNNEKYEETTQTLIIEKETILKNLTKIEEQYNTAIAQNTTLSEELVLQKNSIVSFKDSLKSLKITNWKLIKFYKNKIKGLNRISKKLIYQNDSLVKSNELLNSQNQELNEDKQVLTSDLQKQTSFNDTLVKQNLDLAKKVAIGEIVKVSNFKVTTYRERSGGKFKESTRARRVDMFKISLLLNENPIAEKRNISAHVSIIKPDGNVLVEKGGFTNVDGNRVKFSEESNIPYNKSALISDIIVTVTGEKLDKGTYLINFYTDGIKVGSVRHILN